MTVAVKNKKPIVVSPEALRRAGFRSGQELDVKVSRGAITILPRVPIAGEYSAAERRAVGRGIAASEKDFGAGRSYGPFGTHPGFLASLNEEAAKLGARKRKRAAK